MPDIQSGLAGREGCKCPTPPTLRPMPTGPLEEREEAMEDDDDAEADGVCQWRQSQTIKCQRYGIATGARRQYTLTIEGRPPLAALGGTPAAGSYRALSLAPETLPLLIPFASSLDGCTLASLACAVPIPLLWTSVGAALNDGE